MPQQPAATDPISTSIEMTLEPDSQANELSGSYQVQGVPAASSCNLSIKAHVAQNYTINQNTWTLYINGAKHQAPAAARLIPPPTYNLEYEITPWPSNPLIQLTVEYSVNK